MNYDSYKRKRGSKVRMPVGTLGQLLAAYVIRVNEQERAQVAELARQIQRAAGEALPAASGPSSLMA